MNSEGTHNVKLQLKLSNVTEEVLCSMLQLVDSSREINTCGCLVLVCVSESTERVCLNNHLGTLWTCHRRNQS